ncbi:aldo/keto reductase [Oerskovia sp. M15]
MLGRTGRLVSVVGLGTWQLGADWGEVSEDDARAVLEASAESGVTFFDTADVYGDGRSEEIIGSYLADNPGAGITVATKMGRRAPQEPESYTLANFREWTDRSRRNLRTDRLDLVQLHCPPSSVVDDDQVYDALDMLVAEGAIAAYGVSVETVAEALAAIARPGTATVQIILNAFRLKPLDEVLPAASEAGVGIIARVPLASGLLTGKYTRDDLRGERPPVLQPGRLRVRRRRDVLRCGLRDRAHGSGEFTALVHDVLGPDVSPAEAAIAWIWQQPGVSTVIPGARNVRQATSNAAAGSAEVLGPLFASGIREIYDRYLRESIHDRW